MSLLKPKNNMKTINDLIAAVALSTASLSLLLSGCGDSHHHDGEAVDHHEHTEANHGHVAGGHMQHMEEVRASLKAELKEQYDLPVAAMSDAMIAKGKEIYGRMCVTCHGESGKGDGAASAAFTQKPADFTDSAHSAFYSDQGRLHIIRNGVPGTPMVGWKGILQDDEMMVVYGYVRSLRVEASNSSGAHVDGAYVCPMHPQITSGVPSKCSICGMNLVLKQAPDDHAGHSH